MEKNLFEGAKTGGDVREIAEGLQVEELTTLINTLKAMSEHFELTLRDEFILSILEMVLMNKADIAVFN